MKRALLLFMVLSTIFASYSNNSEKTLKLKKSTSEILMDGKIDSQWSQADSAVSFFQLTPNFAKEPTVKTTAKVLADDENLYCLIIAYASKEEIDVRTSIHDQAQGDFVSLMIDTFNDKQSAYKFGVSAAGIQYDARLIDDARNRDNNWDGIWFSATQVYDWGYVVEIQVPFKSIKFDKQIDEWGLDFDRWISNSSEDLYWCGYEQNEGQRVSKFGKLILDGVKPNVEGLNLEIYPVGIGKFSSQGNDDYKFEGNAGLDIFYNPSSQLTYQLTVNPDFAQIEADPYNVNISKYETYFSERRPFFTQGNEVFMASGKERGSGFYSPMELFYSRRIGKKLADGSEVPLIFGTKAFGRINDIDYGGFVAMTGDKDYRVGNQTKTEKQAYFGAARLRKQIMGNSSLGVLFVGKHSDNKNYGVLDIDGAFRGSNYQLSYQLARSFKNSEGDFAASAGFMQFTDTWVTFVKSRYVGEKFDVKEIGYVPWTGTASLTALSGPSWSFENGEIRRIMIYLGTALTHEKIDAYTDAFGIMGINFQFRSNWGCELNLSAGKSKDSDIKYSSYEVSFSSWFHTNPKWNANFYGNYSKTYNFGRNYLAYFGSFGAGFEYRPLTILELGTEVNMWMEKKPDGSIEDITYNTRPYFSLTPINNLNIRVYVDNVYLRSSSRFENAVLGFLFSYNFSPKSWIYFALNDLYDRSPEFDKNNNLLPDRFHLKDRAGVLKIKYLYYL